MADNSYADRVKELWQQYDLDTSGFLEGDELKTFLSNVVGVENYNDALYQQFMNKYDVN